MRVERESNLLDERRSVSFFTIVMLSQERKPTTTFLVDWRRGGRGKGQRQQVRSPG